MIVYCEGTVEKAYLLEEVLEPGTTDQIGVHPVPQKHHGINTRSENSPSEFMIEELLHGLATVSDCDDVNLCIGSDENIENFVENVLDMAMMVVMAFDAVIIRPKGSAHLNHAGSRRGIPSWQF